MSDTFLAASLAPSTSCGSISIPRGSSSESITAEVQPKHTNTPREKPITFVPIPNPNAQPSHSTSDSSEILSQSLALTDLIFGIYAVELWAYNETNGKLFNVGLGSRDEETGQSGGLLVKRRTQESNPENSYPSFPEAQDAFEKLTDPSRKDFLPPSPTDPGVGLPGVLWAEQSSVGFGGGVNNLVHRRTSSLPGRASSLPGRASILPGILRASGRHGASGGGDNVVWRDVGALANDPDQPYNERLQSFAKAGFGLAAGVPFDSRGYRGIVIYYGNPHADSKKLRHPANSNFMINAAQLIGCAAAIQAPMKEVKTFREEVIYQNWHRLRFKITSVVRVGRSLRCAANEQADNTAGPNPNLTGRRSLFTRLMSFIPRSGNNANEFVKKANNSTRNRTSRWLKKVRGGSAGVPPAFSYRQGFWTFVGVIITHTILSRINLLIKTESNYDLSLVLAPLGAMTTLQYNLTAAPASQPRNAIFAQIFAVTTAILVSYIPNVEPWFRSALAPAIVIPGMAILGIIHPPAGAAAIVFSSGEFRWEHFGIFLSGVAITIITAVGINNMSDKRQYPTSWYLLNKAKKHCSK